MFFGKFPVIACPALSLRQRPLGLERARGFTSPRLSVRVSGVRAEGRFPFGFALARLLLKRLRTNVAVVHADAEAGVESGDRAVTAGSG